METLNQTNNKIDTETGSSFDKESRENYFKMLEQAFINLLLVDNELVDLEELVEES